MFSPASWSHLGKLSVGVSTSRRKASKDGVVYEHSRAPMLITRSFARSDALQWTACVGECLSTLEREQESPLDAILVQRVKINRIVEKANLALVRHIQMSLVEERPQLTLFAPSHTTPHSRKTVQEQCYLRYTRSPCKQILTGSSTTCHIICSIMVSTKQT